MFVEGILEKPHEACPGTHKFVYYPEKMKQKLMNILKMEESEIPKFCLLWM